MKSSGSDQDRASGVYGTDPYSADSIAQRAREIVPRGAIAVLLAPAVGRGPVCASIGHAPVEDLGFSLALRLAAWLQPVQDSGPIDVPAYVKDWFPVSRVAVVPMRTPCWTAGWMVVSLEQLTRTRVRDLEELGAEAAVAIETADRRSRLATLRMAVG